MFAIAVLTGIYSYGIFLLGILGILTKPNIAAFTFSWLVIFVLYFRDKIRLHLIKLGGKTLYLFGFLIILLLVNLIGVFGPELGFDALWYHLTLPKIWLMEHVIRFIPGSVYKYSVMPKLAETLYVLPLVLMGEVGAKLIHYLFGILSLLVTYRLSRKYLPVHYALLATLILAGNLVFAWQSTTAYIDLVRTYFEILALDLLLEKKIISSAVTLGLAITTKLLSVISLPVFLILLIREKYPRKQLFIFSLFALLIPLPWLLLAYITTGNPVYPFFSPMYPAADFSYKLHDLWVLFTSNVDPLSPIYLITAPLLLFKNIFKEGRGEIKIFIYCLLALGFWFITPRTGGGRFILPYLPAFSVAVAVLVYRCRDKFIKNVIIFLILLVACTTAVYRFAANYKYLQVITGRETRSEFLSQRLNFSFGDYYDTDNYLADHLKADAVILPVGINNLFYLKHRFITPGVSPFSNPDYILVRYTDTTFRPNFPWQLVHTNTHNKTQLYAVTNSPASGKDL